MCSSSHAVPDGDVADRAALGGHDDRDLGRARLPGMRTRPRLTGTARPARRKPAGRGRGPSRRPGCAAPPGSSAASPGSGRITSAPISTSSPAPACSARLGRPCRRDPGAVAFQCGGRSRQSGCRPRRRWPATGPARCRRAGASSQFTTVTRPSRRLAGRAGLSSGNGGASSLASTCCRVARSPATTRQPAGAGTGPAAPRRCPRLAARPVRPGRPPRSAPRGWPAAVTARPCRTATSRLSAR